MSEEDRTLELRKLAAGSSSKVLTRAVTCNDTFLFDIRKPLQSHLERCHNLLAATGDSDVDLKLSDEPASACSAVGVYYAAGCRMIL